MTTQQYEISYDHTSNDFRVDFFFAGLPSIWRRTPGEADEAARAELARQRKTHENLAAGEVAQANAEVAAAVQGYEPDAEERAEVNAWLDELEAEPVAYTLPPVELLTAALETLQATAEAAGDAANARALGRALALLEAGAYARVAVRDDGSVEVPSQRPGEAPYLVTDRGCPCQSGRWGKPCTHSALVEGLALARDEMAAQLDDAAEYRRAA